ncbi:MAG TPA: penicillin-binding protein 2 [Rubrobacter sp.]|nr:penicillin-binding protein 2 [Rubrobacter sp.]
MLRLPVPKQKQANPAKKRVETPPMTKGNMQVRVVSLAVLIAAVFLILGARLWYLQVLTGQDYTLAARATQHTNIKIPAQRGVIYDRDGKILANNVPGLNVTVIPDEISRDKVKELAKVVGADSESVLARYDAAFDTGSRYSPILVKENAGRDAVTYVSERTSEFKGVAVNDDWVRSYPEGRLAAHILGYTGAVTQEELKLDTFKGLDPDAVVGKSGVEYSYEEVLRGKAGRRTYNVDALGRIVPEGSRVDSMGQFVDKNGNPVKVSASQELPDHVEEPVPGKNLQLTVDLDVQKLAEDELDAAIARTREAGYEGRGGAVVAMDPRNGEILALASRPDFDPQLFVGGISGEGELRTYQQMTSDAGNYPFTDRAITGGQPAASTFKTFTGLAGLASGVIDRYTTYTDTGDCWHPTGVTVSPCYQSWRENSPNAAYLGTHGTQNYAEALKDSNDKFFYQVADWIWNNTYDKDWLPHFYERFGFGSLTGIDLAGETSGRVPTEAGEKELAKALGTPEEAYWSVGDWVNLAIGQGDLLISPIQLATAYSAVENGGTLVTPHVGHEIQNQDGSVVEKISPKPEGNVGLPQDYLENAREGLRGVPEHDGTAGPAFVGSTLPTLGKSGTGELPSGKDFVNWYVGWAENEESDPLVVVVMIEGGGAFQTGSEMTAAPAVRHILESYYGVEQSPKDPNPTDAQPIGETDETSGAPSE